MRRQPIQVVTMRCPRCGKEVCGLSRSLYGADAAHAKYSGICAKCVTEEEKKEIETAQVNAILGR